MKPNQQMRGIALGVAITAAALGWCFPQGSGAQEAPRKVVLRFAADFTLPPHPAGMALAYFHDRLPQVIPGSEARIYYAGALYTIPEAFEAMRQGNLEMAWMQMGKAAPVDPDRKSTRLNSSHIQKSRMPSSA